MASFYLSQRNNETNRDNSNNRALRTDLIIRDSGSSLLCPGAGLFISIALAVLFDFLGSLASTAANEPLLTALFRYTGFSIARARGTARKTALVDSVVRHDRLAGGRHHLVFPQKAAASVQKLQVVNNFLDRCFPMLYLSESRFRNWTRKWLLSDMHGCRRGTKTWPARSPSCRPPAAATFSKRRPRARRPTGPSWRR